METPTRADAAYEALRRAIIEQALAPGAKLREDEIGAHFGVSRTLARAALSRLQSEGLVDAQRKRVATVASPSVEEARAIFEVRRCLERETVRLVVERWSPEMAARLLAHVDEEDEAARRGDAAAAGRLAGEFHIVLAGLTGNPLLARYVSEVVSRSSLILAVHGRPHQSDCATAEHRGVIAALAARDADRAAALMAAHLAAVTARALPETPTAPATLSDVLARYAG
ncbi:GntR family transcriptional regulator [Chenggangzhangella methanolivorans]|uniref:GntR family transcriptional regulator n=2 Tax=Chenggangzhangella methanolivorans TaxID=1437009 RepID=A0A9E6RIQ9_9HYPH|nr:GntR family transcriptional regulator [Chenggangzhangella methanolivorans]